MLVFDRFSLRPTETDQDNQRGLQRDEASGLYDTKSLSKVADQKLKAFKMVGSDVKITTMSLWQLKKL